MKSNSAAAHLAHVLTLALLLSACTRSGSDTPAAPSTIGVTSTAFTDGSSIPPQYTCDGQSAAVPLSWTGVPSAAKSLAVLVQDPDAPAGTFTHWIVWGIPPTAKSLDASALPQGAVQGQNDFDSGGWGAPCPPSGTHHYVFTLFALDTVLAIPGEDRVDGFIDAIKGHVIAKGVLTGTYQRK